MKRKKAEWNVSVREKLAVKKGRTYTPQTKWGKALVRKVDLVVSKVKDTDNKVDANALKTESALRLAVACKQRLDVNDRATGELVSGWASRWLSGCLAGQAALLAGWLAGRFTGWMAGCLAGCLAGWLAGGSVGPVGARSWGDGEGGSREAAGAALGPGGWGGEWSLVVDLGWMGVPVGVICGVERASMTLPSG